MSVILIGFVADGSVGAIGEYESPERAQQAIRSREVPSGYKYAVFETMMNRTMTAERMGAIVSSENYESQRKDRDFMQRLRAVRDRRRMKGAGA